MNINSLSQGLSYFITGWNQIDDSVPAQVLAAIDSDSPDKVDELLCSSLLAVQSLPNNELPLNYAIRHGRLEIVKVICSKFPDIIEQIDSHGLTSINHAIISGDANIIGTVLASKLHADFENVKASFSKGNDMPSFEKEIAFANSIKTKCTPELAKLQGIFQAIAEGDFNLISEYLDLNSDVNATNENGWSLLHLAVHSGNAKLVKLLIEKGARTDLITKAEALTPLHIAAVGNNREMIQDLLGAGAELAVEDKEGSTPLHYAMTQEQLFSAQLMVEKGANYTKKNIQGMSPLSVMAALSQVHNEDPLAIGDMQAWMFAAYALALLTGYAPASIQIVLALISMGLAVNGVASAFINTKSVKGKALLIGSIGLSMIPGINIIPLGLKTGIIGFQCLKGIKTAWQHRHLEKARPLRNIIVYGMNASYTAHIFSLYFKFTRYLQTSEGRDNHHALFNNGQGSTQQTPLNPHFIFTRELRQNNSTQIPDLSKQVFDHLKANNNQTYVDFTESSLTPFDNHGTCSAMALDFISRMNNQCSKNLKTLEFLDCVTSVRPFYKASTPEFASIQAAYNTITVLKNDKLMSLHTITFQKMQALGSYHNLTFTPVTGILSRDENIVNLLNELPNGSFVVRLLHPVENHKIEEYGHTMGFIKRDEGSIFYDNFRGALLLESDFGSSVVQSINYWDKIPTVRIYKAECPSAGCINLAAGQVE